MLLDFVSFGDRNRSSKDEPFSVSGIDNSAASRKVGKISLSSTTSDLTDPLLTVISPPLL